MLWCHKQTIKQWMKSSCLSEKFKQYVFFDCVFVFTTFSLRETHPSMLPRLLPPFCNRVNRKLKEAMTINPVPNSLEILRPFSLPSVTMPKITTSPKRSIDNQTDNRWYSWDSTTFLDVCDSLKLKKQRCNAKNHFQTSPVSYLFDNPEKALLGRELIRNLSLSVDNISHSWEIL